MKEVADTYHLQNRKGTWYYVRRVPTELRAAFGCAVVKKTLQTKSKKEAKRLRTVEDVKFDARSAQLLTTIDTTDVANAPAQASLDEVLSYIRLAVATRDSKSAQELIADPPKDAWEKKDLLIDAEIEYQILTDPDDPRRDQAIDSFIAKIMKQADLSLAYELNAPVKEFGRRALIELCRRRRDRYDDRFDRTVHDALFAPGKSSVTFEALSTEFLKEVQESHSANNVGRQRQEKVRAFTTALVEIVGPNVLVEDLDDKAVQQVRSTLVRMPTNRYKHYNDLPLDEVLIQAAQDGRATLSSTTQSDYLRVFKQLMQFAARRKYLTIDPSLEAKPLTKPKPLEERRMPFSVSQLQHIFGSDFYHRCSPSASDPYCRSDRAWRFWFPLLMIFSAARPNEIAQLCVADIRKSEAGNLFLNLMPDAGTSSMQLKTSSSRRRIPIHVELVALGFLAFVAQRRDADGDKAALFPTLKASRFGNLAWYPCRRFNEVFLPAVIEVGPDQSFYSLRHSVRDALRRADATPEVLRAIGGWSDNGRSVSDFYGDATNPDLYVKWVNAISYPGLDLSHLYV